MFTKLVNRFFLTFFVFAGGFAYGAICHDRAMKEEYKQSRRKEQVRT